MKRKGLAVAATVAVLVGGFPAPTSGDGGLPPPTPPAPPGGLAGPASPSGSAWGTPAAGGGSAPPPRSPDTLRKLALALSLAAGSEAFVDKNVLGKIPGAGSAWPGGTPAPRRGREPGWKFLPPVPFDALSLSLLISTGQHSSPYVSPDFFAAASLIEIGEPSLLALSAARGLGPTEALTRYVENGILPLPERPVLQALSAAPAEAMVQRLVLEDLAGGYAHSQSAPLAPRLTADRSIAVGVLSKIIEATKNPHPLVRRNAVHLLGSLRTEVTAEDELCRVLESADDLVCRFRALHALMTSTSPRGGTILRKQIRTSRDEYYRNYALYALAFIDPEGSRETARAILRGRPRDDDECVWAALQCLFGGAPLDEPSREEVKRLETALAAAEGSEDRVLDLSPALKPYRVCVLRRMAWCALALSGEQPFRDRIVRALEPGPARRVLARFPDTTSFMALEVLAKLCPETLWKVVQDEKEETELRSRAIFLLAKPDPKQAGSLKDLSSSLKAPLILRASAMAKLAEVDAESSAEAARKLIEAFADYQTLPDDLSAEWAALTAARHLADLKAPKIGLFIRALERALKDREARRRRAAQAEARAEESPSPSRLAPHVPLVEGLIGMLASSGVAEAVAAVRKILKTGRGGVAAEAALALGESGAPGVEADLLEGLESTDGWVRFCSYTALRRIIQKDTPCDWIYSSGDARRPFVKTWKAWVAQKQP